MIKWHYNLEIIELAGIHRIKRGNTWYKNVNKQKPKIYTALIPYLI